MSPPVDMLALATCALACTAAAQARPEFIPLEPPPGAWRTYVTATDGVQQVGYTMVPGPPAGWTRACVWSGTPESYVDLHPAGARTSRAYGVDAGRQVGTAEIIVPPSEFGPPHAALWNGTASSFVSLGYGDGAAAYGISGGTQVGFVGLATPRHPGYQALRWAGSGDSRAPLAGGDYSVAFAISGPRAVGYAAHFVGAGTFHEKATAWSTTAPFVSLSLGTPTSSSRANALFGDTVVGIAMDDGFDRSHAVMWDLTTGTEIQLGRPLEGGSEALAVCTSIQVGYSFPNFLNPADRRACMWRGSASSYVELKPWLVARGLNLTDWALTEATGVSPDGTMIVGNGTNNGVNMGWIIRLDGAPTNPEFPCAADLDNGTFTPAGLPDGAVTIDDLVYFLGFYNLGRRSVDLDDGSGTGYPDGAVTIDDLLYFLRHFEQGC